MRFDIKNPWLVGILGGAVGAILSGVVLYYSFEYREQKAVEAIVMTSINNADSLLEKNMNEEALAIYNDALKVVSSKKDAYGHINNSRGICYYNLAIVKDKEDNLTRAIQAYEQALKIRTVEKYPVDYAMTQNNLGNAYSTLAEVRDKEANLKKAIQTYEQALKIYTLEKYPLYHKVVMSNMENAKERLKAK